MGSEMFAGEAGPGAVELAEVAAGRISSAFGHVANAGGLAIEGERRRFWQICGLGIIFGGELAAEGAENRAGGRHERIFG